MTDWIPDLSRSDKPRYIAIAEDDRRGREVRAARAGGDRLPPQRKLAARLVDRLHDGGARLCRGTAAWADRVARRPRNVRARGTPTLRSREGDARADIVDLSMNLPPEPTDPDLDRPHA